MIDDINKVMDLGIMSDQEKQQFHSDILTDSFVNGIIVRWVVLRFTPSTPKSPRRTMRFSFFLEKFEFLQPIVRRRVLYV